MAEAQRALQQPEQLTHVLEARAQKVLGIATNRLMYQSRHTTWIQDDQLKMRGSDLMTAVLEPSMGESPLEGFAATSIGVTCVFAKTTPSGETILLEVDTASPYAEFAAQKLDAEGNAISSFAITRVARPEDGDFDNWYSMTGYDVAQDKHAKGGTHALNFAGYNTTWERFADFPGLR